MSAYIHLCPPGCLPGTSNSTFSEANSISPSCGVSASSPLLLVFPLLVHGITTHPFFSAVSHGVISSSSLYWNFILALSNQFAHLMDSSSKIPLESSHHSIQTAASLLPCSELDHFSPSPNLSAVLLLYQLWFIMGEDQWMFLGPSFWQCLWTQPVQSKIDQIFQSFMMWPCASESIVMMYFIQPKKTFPKIK